jgi:hypothetical protein
MAALTPLVLGGLSLAVTAAGTAASIAEQQKSNKMQKQAIEIQRNQADLEAGRSRRQVYRDMLKAQASSETNAAASGGLASSSLQGGLAQATNSGFQSTRDINQNQQNANRMFDVKSASVGIGQTSNILNGIGKGLSSLSGYLSGPRTT